MNSQPLETQTLLAEMLEAHGSSHPAPVHVARVALQAILDNGQLLVAAVSDSAVAFRCDVLESALSDRMEFCVGDQLLALLPERNGENGCVLGRVTRYRPPTSPTGQTPARLLIEATEELTIKCGHSSVDLRNDGKVMIRGNDVLTRAKRTQRIKGGSVAIN